jgi:hypothetical protein
VTEKAWAFFACRFGGKKTGVGELLGLVHPTTLSHSVVLASEHSLEVAILATIVIRGHKPIEDTLKYTDLETSLFGTTDDQFIAKVATNVADACKLAETGFE